MKNLLLVLLLGIVFINCKSNSDQPDVSGIKVEIPIERFDQDFFSLDTNNISIGLKKLADQYPDFYLDFMQQVLGISGSDTSQLTKDISRQFIKGYSSVFQDLRKTYDNTNWLESDLKKAFQFVKYYYPDFKTGKTILFLGPFDAPGVAVTRTGLAIGLHQFAGKDFPPYQTIEAQQLFPSYISRRFEPQYIVANCMKAVVEDIYPDKSVGKGLVEQMIEKGKRWWLLDKFLPSVPDSIKTGYTINQLEFCKRNEGLIWQKIIQDEKDIYTIEPAAIQMYIGEAPFTQNMGENSPGNIGPWIGWQIIKKYVSKNTNLSVDEVMKTDARKILDEAKYKPK